VDELNLPKKNKVYFALRRPGAEDEKMQLLIDDFYRLAESLGFRTSSVSY
jgi:hypothetical protein